MRLYAIGDVHGKMSQYEYLLDVLADRNPDNPYLSVQLGDMGIGFRGVELPDNIGPNNLFFSGNHDDHKACQIRPGYLGSYSSFSAGDLTVFTLRGAHSIDWECRKEWESWWSYEQVSYQEGEEALALYAEIKPDVMLTHDGPQSVVSAMCDITDTSYTRSLLDKFLRVHRPKIWCFGHHHHIMRRLDKGTDFYILAELQVLDITYALTQR